MGSPIVVATGPSRLLVGGQRRHLDLLEVLAGRLGYAYVPVEIGQRPGERNPVDLIKRLLRDYMSFLKAVRSAVRTQAPVAVHVNSSVQYASLLRDLGFAVIARMLRPHQLLVQIHGCELYGPDDRKPVMRALARILAVVAGRMVVLSASQAHAIGGPALSRGLVIPNSIQLQDAPRRPIRRTGMPIRALFLARLVPEKGVLNSLEAIALLKSQGADVRLTIVGEGPMLAELPQRVAEMGIEDRVQVLGPVSSDRVRALLIEHDLMWAPYLGAEGQPYSMIEALEAGMPIIATAASPAMQEMISLADGALVEVAMTSEDLAAKTRLMQEQPERLAQLQCRARQIAEREYSLEAAIPRWQAAWSAPTPTDGYPRPLSS